MGTAQRPRVTGATSKGDLDSGVRCTMGVCSTLACMDFRAGLHGQGEKGRKGAGCAYCPVVYLVYCSAEGEVDPVGAD